jgi:hypothetical protein
MAASRKALALDPLAPLINMNVRWTYCAAGRPVEASHQAAKMIESDPDFYGAYWLQGAIHLSAGEYQAAVGQLRSAVSLGGHQVVVTTDCRPIVELFNWVAANPAPAATGDPFSCETLGIEMTGRVATARVRDSDHHGVVIDHFHLLKVRERWSIVSKLWDGEP